MKLSATEMSSRVAAGFGGSLLFQPVSVTEGEAQRPVAMLASVAQLIPQAAALPDTAPSLRNPLFDLLHHDPAAVRQKR